MFVAEQQVFGEVLVFVKHFQMMEPTVPVYEPRPAAPAPVPITPVTEEALAARVAALQIELLERMEALSAEASDRLTEVRDGLHEQVTALEAALKVERDARLARELRERNEARAKQIAARLLGGE